MELTLGRVVFSKAGRDKTRPFVILEVQDAYYVLIADGDLRKIASPKRKKIKHLSFTNTVLDSIKSKIEKKIEINDTELRKGLEVMRRNL